LSRQALARKGQKRLSAEARREVIEVAATELFAARGYHGTSMEEIARRSGVSVPVVYDHFASKDELHRRLLERHFAELRAIWRSYLPGDEPVEARLSRTLDAWFAYVQEHPYAWRMLFRDTTGEPGLEAIRQEVAGESQVLLLQLLSQEPGIENVAAGGPASLELAWQSFRSLIQGLALWWYDNQDVPREQLVAAAMNVLWIGFERVRCGETWPAETPTSPRAAP
jgi:AcrR family transcriptional regulator